MPRVYTTEQKKEWVQAYQAGKSVAAICEGGPSADRGRFLVFISSNPFRSFDSFTSSLFTLTSYLPTKNPACLGQAAFLVNSEK